MLIRELAKLKADAERYERVISGKPSPDRDKLKDLPQKPSSSSGDERVHQKPSPAGLNQRAPDSSADALRDDSLSGSPVTKGDDDEEDFCGDDYLEAAAESDEEETTELRVSKCGHLYCASCVSKFIKVKKKCPVCNQSMGKPYPLFL